LSDREFADQYCQTAQEQVFPTNRSRPGYLGKTTFHLVALGIAGKVLVRKKFTQRQLLTYTSNMQMSLIGLEACSGAHFLGRALRKQGHDVRLIAAQFVKPFVESNKNDFVDAEAIAEAVERKNMRFVPIKTDDQLDLQAIHRVRDRLISRCTAVINQLRTSKLLTFVSANSSWPASRLRRHQSKGMNRLG
jgi:transposase